MILILRIFHVLIALSLISLILLQSSKGGLGSTFGGGEVYRTRRGTEKVVFHATIVLSALFLLTSIVSLLM